MKKIESLKKKITAMLMMVVMAASLVSGAAKADAATAMSNVSIVCYLRGNSRANTYQSVNGAYSGYIDAGDQCTILAVYNNGWVKVSYPVNNGRNTKTAYTQASNFFTNTDFSTSKVNAGSNYTVYKKSNLASSLGTVYGSDSVILVGIENGKQQIIYPVSGTGKYKMGFINGSISASATIREGTYFIETALKRNMILDVSGVSTEDGANIHIWENCNGNNQIFYVRKSGNYYIITAVHSGKTVDVSGGSAASGTNVHQWSFNDSNAQKWIIMDAGDGYYYIVSALGTYLDVSGAGTENGTNVQAHAGNQTNAQKWKFISTSANATTSDKKENTTLTNGLYKLNTTSSKLTCGFDGYKTTSGRHEGIDFSYGYGKKVYSLTDGVIVNVVAGQNGSKGLSTIAVYNAQMNKTVIYLHSAPLSSLKVGQTITKGTQIATEAWRGCSSSSGTHTHVEVRDGKQTLAAKSVNDYTLSNSNPTSFWNNLGYSVK